MATPIITDNPVYQEAYYDAPETIRFPPASPTEELSQYYPIPDATPYAVAVLLCVAAVLIIGACYLVARVDSHAFAVLSAVLVAGFVWLAFGATE